MNPLLNQPSSSDLKNFVTGNKLVIPEPTFQLPYNDFTRLIDQRLEAMKKALYEVAKQEYKARHPKPQTLAGP